MLSEIELRKLSGARLKEARDSKGLSQKQLSEIVHLTEATVSRYESGKMKAKQTISKVFAEYLGVSPAWLMGLDVPKYIEKEDKRKFKQIPILGTIAAGQPIYCEEHIEGYESVLENSKATFCLKVRGNSMINARIYDGDIVYIREQPEVETGEIAAVIIDGENATLKRFYKMGNQIILRPENPAHKEQIYTKAEFRDVKIIGKCIAVKFWLE